MQFKYFDQPELFTGYIGKESICDTCDEETNCFDGGLFFGEEAIDAICPACLAAGELNDKDVYTNRGDIEELKQQLRILHPTFTDAAISELATAKTKELEKNTPHLITWQDWDWPCADGDYCKFIGYGSKKMYEKLAEGKSAKEFFAASIHSSMADLEDAEILWKESLPAKPIKNYEESSEQGTLFYVFKSLHSEQIITLWDSE